jgi:hypothetical protein
MSNLPPAIASHIAQLWGARLAEQESANADRLARWQVRAERDPVAVPALKEVAWLSSEKVEPINLHTLRIFP